MGAKGFASDNNSGIHPEVIKKITEVNKGHCIGYGDDEYTIELTGLLKKHFGNETEPYLALTGTGANTLVIKSLLHSYQSVVCTETAHINVDECGAPEHFTGSKIIALPSNQGKLMTSDIAPLLHVMGFEHHTQPKLISISNCTEMGTVYNTQEIKQLADFAHQHNMFLHIDGARIANAAAALNKNFKEITFDCGVDVISFGGTKNGLMMGEAIIFKNSELGASFKYIRKQGMQLYSKMRFIAAQFMAYFENNLWYHNASHANNMAQLLFNELSKISGIEFTMPVEANGLFLKLPHTVAEKLQESYFFYDWDYNNAEYRLMTSWDTTEEDIKGFIDKLKELL